MSTTTIETVRQCHPELAGGGRAIATLPRPRARWDVSRFSLCVTMTCSLAVAGHLSGDEPKQPDPSMRAMKLLDEGHHLAALRILEGAEGKDPGALQVEATIRSFLGDHAGAAKIMDEQFGAAGKDPEPELPDGVKPADALDAIVERAKDRRVVIVNEAHHVPQHRAFIAELARRLKKEGFTYYAAEAFGQDISKLAERGYPDRTTGFYIREPVFGELIREVLDLGYRPVAYEATPKPFSPDDDPVTRVNAREAEQCKNLVDRIFKQDPKARVLIHVGYSHAREKPQGTGDKQMIWMAARLAEATGLDPLTIDQTTHTARSEPRFATPEWRAARDRGWLDRPVLLLSADGEPIVTGGYAGAVDLQVFHPPAKSDGGRPDWLAKMPGRRRAEIPEGIVAGEGPILVQAFLDDESDDAVPVDQVVLRPDEDRPVLLLRPGRYRVVVQDERGDEVKRMPLAVE